MTRRESYNTLDVLVGGIFNKPLKTTRVLKGKLTLKITNQRQDRNYLNLNLEFRDGLKSYTVLCDVFKFREEVLAYEFQSNGEAQIKYTDGELSKSLIDNILHSLLEQMVDLDQKEGAA